MELYRGYHSAFGRRVYGSGLTLGFVACGLRCHGQDWLGSKPRHVASVNKVAEKSP